MAKLQVGLMSFERPGLRAGILFLGESQGIQIACAEPKSSLWISIPSCVISWVLHTKRISLLRIITALKLYIACNL